MFDKKGNFLEVGQSVKVDEPETSTSETYMFGFAGTVESFRDNHVIVEDMDGDCFCVNPENLQSDE